MEVADVDFLRDNFLVLERLGGDVDLSILKQVYGDKTLASTFCH
jgi:hypothetical protein